LITREQVLFRVVRAALLALACCTAWLGGRALAQPVLILYPVVREPYDRVYRDTLAGIGQVYDGDSRTLPVRSARDLTPTLLTEDAPRIAVALGNSAARALVTLDPGTPVITTATADIPFKRRHQLAYYPDPPLLLEQLRRFGPDVRRVKLVSPPEAGAYQTRVQRAFATAGIELELCTATGLKEAAGCYRGLLEQAAAGDAVWILHGGSLLEPSLLSYILDVAWRRQLPVFSSNPAHAGRGALIALYPDDQAAGRQLGALINDCLRSCNGEPSLVSYLREMRIVVNERTSRHLGLEIPPDARQGVDLIL
jgi:ABC-type uncharacterized transport system, periplasmic component